MKRLYLTAVVTVPSEEGQKRIDEALEKRNLGIQNIFKDEKGRSRADWETILGDDKVPDWFEQEEKDYYKNNPSSEINENDEIFLENHELEYDFVDYLLPLKNFFDMRDAPEIGSYIKTVDGEIVHVEQTVEEINLYLTMLELSWWEKFKIRFSNLFERKNK